MTVVTVEVEWKNRVRSRFCSHSKSFTKMPRGVPAVHKQQSDNTHIKQYHTVYLLCVVSSGFRSRVCPSACGSDSMSSFIS